MHFRSGEFELNHHALHVPVCAMEILGAMDPEAREAVDLEQLQKKCRGCVRRFNRRGWMSDDSVCGVWKGCVHETKIKAVLAA